MLLPYALPLPQAAGQPLLARTATLCPPGSLQVTSAGLASAIYYLMLQLPLADTLPPSAVHKPSSNAFYVHVQGQAQGYPGFQWLKKDSSFSPPCSCPPWSTANRRAGLKMLSGVGLHASCSVVLQKGKLRPKGMPEWFPCPESVSRHFSYYGLLSAFSAASTVLGT